MKFALAGLASVLLVIGNAEAALDMAAAEAMMKKDGCAACHAVDKKIIGPSYPEVAAKYKGQADAEAKLVDKLSKAQGHPAVKASPDDLKGLVKWVLSM